MTLRLNYHVYSFCVPVTPHHNRCYIRKSCLIGAKLSDVFCLRPLFNFNFWNKIRVAEISVVSDEEKLVHCE